MGYETILYDLSDRVATITLNRPERMNAWNATMSRELSEAMLACDADDEVRAVVVTGAGRAFCAGADLSGGGGTFGSGERRERPAAPRFVHPFELRKPVIAALNGHAVGVGLTYPMLCDVRFVAEDAKLQFAFVRRGVIPELASHVIVARVAGLSNAADLLLSGRLFLGREAAELGLASAALPRQEVLARALDFARDLATNTAPVSVALSKKLLWEGLGASPLEMRKREDKAFAWIGNQPDAKEGVVSFLERRTPEWSGSASRDLPE